MMDRELLQELNKKDDDLEVLSYGPNEIVLATTLPNLDEELGIEEVEDNSSMLIDEALGPKMDVIVQVVRFMFMVNCLLSCLILTGFIPYQFLVYDEKKTFVYAFFGVWLFILLVIYLLMAGFRRARLAPVLLVFYFISFYIVLIDIAAILRDFAPLQFGLITFAQSLGIIVYTIWSPTYIDHWKSFYLMLGLGIIGWAVGLYAFVIQRDWVPAVLLLVAAIGSAAYSAVQVKHASRYSVSYEDGIESCIRFYADPVILIYNKIKI